MKTLKQIVHQRKLIESGDYSIDIGLEYMRLLGQAQRDALNWYLTDSWLKLRPQTPARVEHLRLLGLINGRNRCTKLGTTYYSNHGRTDRRTKIRKIKVK